MKKTIFVMLIVTICTVVVDSSHAYSRRNDTTLTKKYIPLEERRAKKVEKEAQIYSTDAAPNPYVIIGKLSFEKATNFGTCDGKIGTWAAKNYGADAILNFNLIHAHLCEGIAVRWAEEGEEGLTAITPTTPIPVVKGKKVTFRW
jgi:hypothetical protein